MRKDARQVLSDPKGFAVPVVFTTPGNSITRTINAIAIKHSTSFNPDTGEQQIGFTARVTVVESLLTEAGYPVHNNDQTIALRIIKWRGRTVRVLRCTAS